jgi:ribosomal protein L37AE/L43A
MAMRAATMSSYHSPTTAGESDSFTRKLAILLLLVVNTVLGIVLWFQIDRELPLLLSTFFADATLGLAAGFGSRVVFRKWNRVAQYLMAFLSVVIGMFLLGNLTKSVLGIGPLGLEREAMSQIREVSFDSTLPSQLRALQIDPLTVIDLSRMEAGDAAHLAASLLLAVTSLMAWHRPMRQVIEVESLGHAQVEVEPRTVGLSVAPEGSNGSGSRAHQPVTWFRSPTPSATPTPRIRSRNRIRPAVKSEAKSAKSARRSRSRRRPQIQLAVVEEHRCPYCLDPVSRNDARGVKECEVCHTLHHGDCWAITGFCQVPHLNT